MVSEAPVLSERNCIYCGIFYVISDRRRCSIPCSDNCSCAKRHISTGILRLMSAYILIHAPLKFYCPGSEWRKVKWIIVSL